MNLVQILALNVFSLSIAMSLPTLASGTAKSLSKGVELRARHLTHPPIPCDPIFSPPAGLQPELTHLQSHFLIVSIRHGELAEVSADNDRELLVFAIEVLVYTTARLTIIFVSKADSVGYLYLLDLPPKSASLIRNLSTEFLSYLVRAHQRPGLRLVLSLFARSQNWYLFRESAKNPRKHVLDDRGLVKWWCRAFDPILRTFEPEELQQSKDGKDKQGSGEGTREERKPEEKTNASATAYLIVPGCEKPEMRTFFPSTFRADDNQRHPRWVNAYPLYQLSAFPSAPPRCLVPRFPDDPKTRFLVDLDDSIPKGSETGQWPSVKTLDQFWELLAFRQECSAGRLVGFLWMVINPPGVLNSDGVGTEIAAASPTYESSSGEAQAASAVPSATDPQKEGNKQEEVKGEEKKDTQKSTDKATSATESVSHRPPPPGVDANTILLSHEDYVAATDSLGDFVFPDKETSLESTASWLDQLTTIRKGDSSHGETVVGECQPVEEAAPSPSSTTTSNSATNVLRIRKRKKKDETQEIVTEAGTTEEAAKESNAATNGSTAAATTGAVPTEQDTVSTAANVLGSQFIRKKKMKLNEAKS